MMEPSPSPMTLRPRQRTASRNATNSRRRPRRKQTRGMAVLSFCAGNGLILITLIAVPNIVLMYDGKRLEIPITHKIVIKQVSFGALTRNVIELRTYYHCSGFRTLSRQRHTT
jgi:hypothetical protein